MKKDHHGLKNLRGGSGASDGDAQKRARRGKRALFMGKDASRHESGSEVCKMCVKKEGRAESKTELSLTQMAPRCPTVSSFISGYSLCIRLVFKSDAAN